MFLGVIVFSSCLVCSRFGFEWLKRLCFQKKPLWFVSVMYAHEKLANVEFVSNLSWVWMSATVLNAPVYPCVHLHSQIQMAYRSDAVQLPPLCFTIFNMSTTLVNIQVRSRTAAPTVRRHSGHLATAAHTCSPTTGTLTKDGFAGLVDGLPNRPSRFPTSRCKNRFLSLRQVRQTS